MKNQKEIITDILSLYETILNKKNIVEVADVYDNINFKDNVVGNSTPSKDEINLELLNDIQTAAKNANVEVDITTAVTGHDKGTRHETGNAVDIAIINGKPVNPSNKDIVNKFVDELVSMGYVKNQEKNNDKAVLTFGFPGHDNHIHISNVSQNTGSLSSKTNTQSSDFFGKEFVTSTLKSIGLTEEEEKEYKYTDKVITPVKCNSSVNITSLVDGKVVDLKFSRCENSVVIMFKYGYLEYCKMSNPIVKLQDNVVFDEIVGKTNNTIHITLYDLNKKYVDTITLTYKNPENCKDEYKITPDNEYSEIYLKTYRALKNNILRKNDNSSKDKKVDENINRIKTLLK